eukprot:gene16703-19800_t
MDYLALIDVFNTVPTCNLDGGVELLSELEVVYTAEGEFVDVSCLLPKELPLGNHSLQYNVGEFMVHEASLVVLPAPTLAATEVVVSTQSPVVSFAYTDSSVPTLPGSCRIQSLGIEVKTRAGDERMLLCDFSGNEVPAGALQITVIVANAVLANNVAMQFLKPSAILKIWPKVVLLGSVPPSSLLSIDGQLNTGNPIVCIVNSQWSYPGVVVDAQNVECNFDQSAFSATGVHSVSQSSASSIFEGSVDV